MEQCAYEKQKTCPFDKQMLMHIGCVLFVPYLQ